MAPYTKYLYFFVKKRIALTASVPAATLYSMFPEFDCCKPWPATCFESTIQIQIIIFYGNKKAPV